LTAALTEAVQWVRAPIHVRDQFDYVMTARVRLLLFWASRDDVGGGYVRKAVAANREDFELVQVLFGSDPAKAPRRINRWGAGTEVVRFSGSSRTSRQSSVFFGFMKDSEGKSVSEMEAELSKENQNARFLFKGILSRVDEHRAVSRMVPFYTNEDFAFSDLARAESTVLDRMPDPARRTNSIDPSSACTSTAGFLTTVLALMDSTLSGARAPVTSCYVYDSQPYTIRLEHLEPVAERTVRVNVHNNSGQLLRTYRDLLESRFETHNRVTGKRSRFTILYGNSGEFRGVPVQITYQPNWWFQVILNLQNRSSHDSPKPGGP
jgi:hypothetical protein